MAGGKRRSGKGAEPSSTSATRDEQKRERRARRKEEREAARRRKRRVRRLQYGAVAAVLLGGVLALAVVLFWPDPELEGVEQLPNEGREHLASGASYDYGDPAPASGPHARRAPRCGEYSDPLPPTLAVHALEHGAVVLWHRPDVGDEVRDRLLGIMDEHDSHVIVSPNPDIRQPVVATAWQRRMRFADPEDPLVAEFVDTYRNRGPESVDCPV